MNFEVGEKATVRDRYSGPLYVSRVRSSGKLKVTLDDGSEWGRNGKPWGNKDRWYLGPSLVPYSVGDDEKVLRRKLIGALSAIKWQDFETPILEWVGEIVGVCRRNAGGNGPSTASGEEQLPSGRSEAGASTKETLA